MESNYFNMEVITILISDEKMNFIDRFIKLLKQVDIDPDDKKKIYRVVMRMTDKTRKQKRRFIFLYGLKPNKFTRYTLTEMARLEGCKINAIRGSTVAIKSSLWKIPEKDFEVLQSIYKKYQIN